MPAAVLARIKALRRYDRDEIGTLLPMRLVDMQAESLDDTYLEDVLTCFVLTALVEAWAIVPSLRHMNTVVKVVECAKASALSEQSWPCIGLSNSYMATQRQASNARLI